MNTNLLTSVVLRQLFSAFTTEQRPVLMSDPLTSATVPLLDQSLEELNAACVNEGKVAAIKRVSAKCTEADQWHDEACGLLWQLLQLELTRLRQKEGPDAPATRRVEEIIEALYPDGLSQIRKSYFQESIQAPVLFASLGVVYIDTLKGIEYAGESAYEIALRWLAAAEKLGDWLRQKAILEETDGGENGTADKSTTRWRALGRLRLLMVSLDQSSLSATAQKAIMAPVRAAISELEKRPDSPSEGDVPTDEDMQVNAGDDDAHAQPEAPILVAPVEDLDDVLTDAPPMAQEVPAPAC